MGVCRLHWPENAEMKLRFGHLIPAHPPSVFLNCPPSHVRQTVSTRSRDVEKRSISISQTLNRTKCMSFRYVTLSRMILKLFVWNFRRSTKTQSFMLFFFDNVVRLFHFDEDTVHYSVTITSTFSISGRKRNTFIYGNDLKEILGFQHKLSQIQKIFWYILVHINWKIVNFFSTIFLFIAFVWLTYVFHINKLYINRKSILQRFKWNLIYTQWWPLLAVRATWKNMYMFLETGLF